MKVLNVINALDPVNGGGTVERTFQMSRYLAKAGVDCTILTTDSGLTQKRLNDLDGITVVALPSLNKRFFVPAFFLNRMMTLVKNTDIIHLMGHWTVLNALVYLIARFFRKPYVVCPAGLLPIYGRSKLLKIIYNALIGKKIVRNADIVIAVTSGELPHFASYGILQKKIAVIPNGVGRDNLYKPAEEDFEILNKQGLKGKPFILFMGTLAHIKGPDLLLRAFCDAMETLRPYHLVFVGPDRGMLSELKEIVERCNAPDRIHFLGYLGGVEKAIMYHASKLLVIPSRQEAMSIVVLEAGITRTPVLLTDQCGFNEIANFQGGMVVPATIEGLKNGLTTILKDEGKMNIMGENLYQFTCKHFAWDMIIQRYITLYTQVLSRECYNDSGETSIKKI